MRRLLILAAVLTLGCGNEAPAPETEIYERGGRSSDVSFAMADAAPPPSQGAAQQKIIRNGQLGVEVEDLDAAATTVREAVKARGGRIESATRIKDESI